MVATHRFRRAVVLLLAVAASATVLAGCTSTPASPATKAPSAGPSSVSTSSGSPSPSPTPSTPPTPVTLSCVQMLTADQIYAYNPNVGTDPNYAPASGSLTAQAVADKGVACGWLNQTSNEKMEFAIAKPAAGALSALKDAAITTSSSVPTYGVPPTVEGYFVARGGVGEVQAFSKGYWIVGTSTTFLEPGDPAQLVQDILGNLPAG